MANGETKQASSRPEAGAVADQERLLGVEVEMDIRIFSKSSPGTAVRAACRTLTANNRVRKANHVQ